MRRPVRFLLFFFYNTSYTEGSGGALHLGSRVGLANTLCNLSSGSIHIGDNCAFGYNVMLLTGRHNFVDGSRASLRHGGADGGWGGGEAEVPNSGYDIHIGDGCWIASGVIVTGGVTIGRNSIVAANAVVTHDVPEYGIVAGVPARLVGDTRETRSQ
jgi:acetyltransferase-like isoleucine patch superfamily enzyme